MGSSRRSDEPMPVVVGAVEMLGGLVELGAPNHRHRGAARCFGVGGSPATTDGSAAFIPAIKITIRYARSSSTRRSRRYSPATPTSAIWAARLPESAACATPRGPPAGPRCPRSPPPPGHQTQRRRLVLLGGARHRLVVEARPHPIRQRLVARRIEPGQQHRLPAAASRMAASCATEFPAQQTASLTPIRDTRPWWSRNSLTPPFPRGASPAAGTRC